MAVHDLDQEATMMVGTLVNELRRDRTTWSDMVNLCDAIRLVRYRQSSMESEHRHLTGGVASAVAQGMTEAMERQRS